MNEGIIALPNTSMIHRYCPILALKSTTQTSRLV